MNSRTRSFVQKKLLISLAVLCCTASMALAGPNVGGVLVAHDTGLAYSSDTPGPPYGGVVPTSCYDVDVEAPFGDGANQRIWKVYAAFPAGGSPRLQGLAWGIDITPRGSGYVHITTGGMVNSGDFEVTQDGWPNTNGASIGQSFPSSGTKTTLITEVYWFAGYGYGGPALDVQYFCTRTHGVQASMFVDDAPIKNSDPIAGYGCLGFGGPGTSCQPPTGACCGDPSGVCMITTQADCQYFWLGPGTTCDQCPGACCNTMTGGCTVTTRSACAQQLDTVWHWEWLTCAPNQCPQPIGCCCTLEGISQMTTQAACNGYWAGPWVPCDPDPCPGCCCMPDGSKLMTTNAACVASGGFWEGRGVPCDPDPCLGCCCDHLTGMSQMTTQANCQFEWLGAGVECTSVTCPPIGCCCMPDGSRTMTTQANCIGFWAGPFVPCDPDPCPAPTGACCGDPSGVCMITTQAACPFLWLGPGTTCDQCPGACCNTMTGGCTVTTMSTCLQQLDTAWYGMWLDCVPNLCPPPLGCCCTPEGSSQMTTAEACTGYWAGPWVLCNPNPCPGCCCMPDGSRIMTTAPNCAGFWAGAGVSCDPDPCLGCCCMPDLVSMLTTEVDCVMSGGVWAGPGVPCDPIPCPGACCHPDGSCTMTTPASPCSGPNTWHPELLACVPNECPQFLGSCIDCLDGSCAITTQAACVPSPPKVWIPNGGCPPNPDACPTRACCDPNGNCTMTLQHLCPGTSTWHYEWLTCDPNPCPRWGICCCPDFTCMITLEVNCLPPCVWHPFTPGWTVCEPNPCLPPLPLGACCDVAGICMVTTQAGCIGSWISGGVCAPNPCFPFPTEEKSWGEIKNIYR